MAERIRLMRQLLFEKMRELGTPGNWQHIITQTGMFSYTGLDGKYIYMYIYIYILLLYLRNTDISMLIMYAYKVYVSYLYYFHIIIMYAYKFYVSYLYYFHIFLCMLIKFMFHIFMLNGTVYMYTVLSKFYTKSNAIEIHKIVCSVNLIMNICRWQFFINRHIVHYLKLEIALAMPASNNEK